MDIKIRFCDGNTKMNTKFGVLQPIPGKSAYDIAVENGFEGTEEEWLESLKMGDVSEEQIEKAVNKYLDANPVGAVDTVEKDNMQPVTSNAVYNEFAVINALLKTI